MRSPVNPRNKRSRDRPPSTSPVIHHPIHEIWDGSTCKNNSSICSEQTSSSKRGQLIQENQKPRAAEYDHFVIYFPLLQFVTIILDSISLVSFFLLRLSPSVTFSPFLLSTTVSRGSRTVCMHASCRMRRAASFPFQPPTSPTLKSHSIPFPMPYISLSTHHLLGDGEDNVCLLPPLLLSPRLPLTILSDSFCHFLLTYHRAMQMLSQ